MKILFFFLIPRGIFTQVKEGCFSCPKSCIVCYTDPPVLFSANPVVQQAVGYVKELVCDIKGYPTPSADDVTWTKQGASVLLGGQYGSDSFHILYMPWLTFAE